MNWAMIRDDVLAHNGQETLRESAARLGLAHSTVWLAMKQAGYKGRSVTKWEPSELPDTLSKSRSR